jgi:hypothetical protein
VSGDAKEPQVVLLSRNQKDLSPNSMQNSLRKPCFFKLWNGRKQCGQLKLPPAPLTLLYQPQLSVIYVSLLAFVVIRGIDVQVIDF